MKNKKKTGDGVEGKNKNRQKNIGGVILQTKVPVDEYGSSHAVLLSNHALEAYPPTVV